MNEQTNEISHYIAKRLREKRQAAKLNRVAMAYQSDISLVQLRNYESGRSKISAAHLYQCAHTMGVDINYFFKGLKNLTRRIPSTQDNAIQKGQSCVRIPINSIINSTSKQPLLLGAAPLRTVLEVG